jgi:ribosomal protein S16
MVVRIRLARFGRRNLPFWRVVVANAKTRRDGRPLEYVSLVSLFLASCVIAVRLVHTIQFPIKIVLKKFR